MKEDRELGPYSWEEMLEMAGRGEIQPADPVFTESLGDWTEAAQIEDLFSANLPAAYDDAAVPAVVSSVPGPATLTPAAFQARRITLPVILIALAILLLSGGVLAYFLNRGDSELAEEIYLVTPEGELIATGQSAKTTGPPLYSLGPGRVPAGFSRTTPADPEDDDLPPLDPATPQHSVYNVLLNQPSPSTLPVGTPVGYSFNYLTTHSGSVRINGVPLRGGSPLRDIAFNPPVDYSTGRGGGSGFFTVRSAGPVDGFRIRMYAAGTDTVLHERVYDLDLTFTPLVGEAPPDADPDPDPDPADPEPPDPDPDPDPGPGAPEEPVPPEPPDDGGPVIIQAWWGAEEIFFHESFALCYCEQRHNFMVLIEHDSGLWSPEISILSSHGSFVDLHIEPIREPEVPVTRYELHFDWLSPANPAGNIDNLNFPITVIVEDMDTGAGDRKVIDIVLIVDHWRGDIER